MKAKKRLIQITRQLSKITHTILNFIPFCSSSKKQPYSYQLVGEKPHQETHSTIVLYKVQGRAQLLEMSILDLPDHKHFIKHLHPDDAFKLGVIAMSDMITKTNITIQNSEFTAIKKQALKPIKK